MERQFTIQTQQDTEALLQSLDIPYRSANHPEVRTVQEALPHMTDFQNATFVKNLFLKDKKNRYLLLSAPHDADTNLKLLAKVVGGCGGGVRAAAEDALHSILGVQRGAVTPLAVANDEERKLIIVWDKGMMGEGKIIVHPMVNTASTEIEKGDLYKYVKHFGYEPIIVDFQAQEAPQQQKKAPQKKQQAQQEGGKKTKLGLSVTKSGNFSQWYSEVITKGEMIDYYDISGCYIIRPWAYSIWESIQNFFDGEIKKLGVKNAYFPMFVSQQSLNKEKDHVEGFAPEVAWVTRSGKSELAQPIAIRPTSETIMYPAFAKWIRGHRDLPLKVNQWCNVVRWEFKHPTPFIRTREFLWQEGHTAHATLEEAGVEVRQILDLYAKVYEDLLAIPVIKGQKSEKEKFAGGLYTTTVETLILENGRGVQGATSHCLGQNFSNMFDIWFEDEEGQKKFVWQNSWGLTTRSLGVMVMIHGDDKGLVIPPRVAPVQCIVIPIFKSETADGVLNYAKQIVDLLKQLNVRVDIDDRRNYNPGWKFNHWEQKGVPLRLEIGPKDLENRSFRIVRRDSSEAQVLQFADLETLPAFLEQVQSEMFQRTKQQFDARVQEASTWDEFLEKLNRGNIIITPWCEQIECEEGVKQRSSDESQENEGEHLTGSAKTLCMPFEQKEIQEGEVCFNCGNKATKRALWGRSY